MALHATLAGSYFIDDSPFGHDETSFATLGLGLTLWPGAFEAAGVFLSLSLGFAFSHWDSDPDGGPSDTIGIGGEIMIGKDWVLTDTLRVGLSLEGALGQGPGEFADTQSHYGLALVFVISGRWPIIRGMVSRVESARGREGCARHQPARRRRHPPLHRVPLPADPPARRR